MNSKSRIKLRKYKETTENVHKNQVKGSSYKVCVGIIDDLFL